jgi:hypothetical protein
MTSLLSELDTPFAKRRKVSVKGPGEDEAATDIPDIECELPRDAPSDRVCFRVVLVNPGQKKTVSVPIGAGGTLHSASIAITVYPERSGMGLGQDESFVVDQTPIASQDLSSFLICRSFADPRAAEAEVTCGIVSSRLTAA